MTLYFHGFSWCRSSVSSSWRRYCSSPASCSSVGMRSLPDGPLSRRLVSARPVVMQWCFSACDETDCLAVVTAGIVHQPGVSVANYPQRNSDTDIAWRTMSHWLTGHLIVSHAISKNVIWIDNPLQTTSRAYCMFHQRLVHKERHCEPLFKSPVRAAAMTWGLKSH